MKRFFPLVILCLVVVGCSSTESKIEKSTLEYLEEVYNITDAEVEEIEREYWFDPVFGALARIFDGKDYRVTVKVNDSVSTTMTGVVNNRKLILRDDNYIQAKHETLRKDSNTYQKVLEELLQMGIAVENVSLGANYELYHDDIRLLTFELEAQNVTSDSKEVVHRLQTLSNYILEEIDTAIETELILPVLSFSYNSEEFKEETVQFRLSYEPEEKFIAKLDECLLAANLANQVDEDLQEEIEKFNLILAGSRFDREYVPDENDNFRHDLSLFALEAFGDEDILGVMELLRKEGFFETYVHFIFADGSTDRCQAQEVETTDDISRCFGQSKSSSDM